jgi:hypothetical protein
VNGNSTRRVRIEAAGDGVVAHVGLHALGAFADRLGLGDALSERILPAGERLPMHDRGKVLVQAMLMLAGGGESCADIEALRAQERLFGAVPSDSTLYRTFRHDITPATLAGLWEALAGVRAQVWRRSSVTTTTEPMVPSPRPAPTAGHPPAARTARCARAPRWRSSPTWSICPVGPRAPGWSCAANPCTPGAQQTLLPSTEFRYWGHYTDQTGDPVSLDATMRAHAHVEDHIRRLKDSGLCRFPFTSLDANRAWHAAVCFAGDLVRWFQLLCLTGPLARAEPKTLRWRLWHAPARLIHHARRDIIRILDGWPDAPAITAAHARIAALT